MGVKSEDDEEDSETGQCALHLEALPSGKISLRWSSARERGGQ
jgi:hypothetical protein